MFLLLPAALIALIVASPALAVPSSVNDPFKALAARVVKPPEQPVCCLIPLSPVEPVQDDVLLSFEEWKERQFAMENPIARKVKEKDLAAGERPTDAGDHSASASEASSLPTAPQDAPHFRVPITDRFNYASLDCSARVHTSHRSAKSPASILSSKRDRYMLSPCRPSKGESQFVVVELCEDIRIDTVQLANFEFFSGVFKDFTVSVSKTYTTDPEGWTFASTHTAKNIRVVQSFHPPTSLRDFYRYIRIDFHSHYSNEYYCPISLLRVYGLTHLEEYKWDIWETESRARARRDEHIITPVEVKEPDPEPAPAPDPVSIPTSYADYVSAAARHREEGEPIGSSTQTAMETETHAPDVATAPESNDTRSNAEADSLPPPAPSESSFEATDSTTARSVPVTPVQQQTRGQSSSESPVQKPHPLTQNSAALNASDVTTPAPDATAVPGTVSTGGLVSALATTSLVPAPAGGESIYRTIMNRLTALEANHTLYARYVEEHTGAVREMLRRVGEDLGRAEGMGKAQAQTHARTLVEWERQRRRVDAEYQELMRRIEYLSAEVVLEKRLGIAQLLLLLAVLVFMTLTRGSRGEPVMVPSVNRSALRAWGRRHLSLKSLSGSGDWDWVRRLKSRSRSRSPKPAAPKPPAAHADPPIKLEFPSVDEKPPAPMPSSSSKPRPPRLNLHGPAGATRPRSRTRSIGSNVLVVDSPRARSHTPIMRNLNRRPGTPTHAHTQITHTPPALPMQHSVSQGAYAPRSARRWARTAHLHELRGGKLGATRGGDQDGGGVPQSANAAASVMGTSPDVFASPSPSSVPVPMTADPLNLDSRLYASGSGGDPLYRGLDLGRTDDADSWVDTDDGSELSGDGDADAGWPEPLESLVVGA